MSDQEGNSGGGSQLFASADISDSFGESQATGAEAATPAVSLENITPDQISEETTEEPQVQPEAEELPEKYRGKTAQEIAKMHLEAEKAMHQKAQEAADIKRQYDAMQALVQQIPAFQQNQQQNPTQQDTQQKQYFHELPLEEQQQAAQYFAQEFGNDPLDAVYKLAVNQPYTIDQHLKNSQVLRELMRQEMQQHFNSAFENRRNFEQHFANHTQSFIQAHPDFKNYEGDIAKFMNYAQESGFLGQMMNNRVDPLDFAYNYVKGYRSPQLQQAAADVARQNAETQAREKQSGFQVGQKTLPKMSAAEDPFGIFKAPNAGRKIFE